MVKPCGGTNADGSLNIFPRGIVALQVEVQTRQTEEERRIPRLRLSRQLQTRDRLLQVARMQQCTRFVDPDRYFALQFVVVLLFLRQLRKPRQSSLALRRLAETAPGPRELIEDSWVIFPTQLYRLFQLCSRLFKLTQTIQRGAQQEVSLISLWLHLNGLSYQRHRVCIIARPRQQIPQAGQGGEVIRLQFQRPAKLRFRARVIAACRIDRSKVRMDVRRLRGHLHQSFQKRQSLEMLIVPQVKIRGCAKGQ